MKRWMECFTVNLIIHTNEAFGKRGDFYCFIKTNYEGINRDMKPALLD